MEILRKIKRFFFNKPHFTKSKAHFTHEVISIAPDGKKTIFYFGVTSYGKNSSIPTSSRKPQVTIDIEKR